MKTGRFDHALVMVGDKVITVGGDTKVPSNFLDSIEEYDSSMNTWKILEKKLKTPRANFGFTLVPHSIFHGCVIHKWIKQSASLKWKWNTPSPAIPWRISLLKDYLFFKNDFFSVKVYLTRKSKTKKLLSKFALFVASDNFETKTIQIMNVLIFTEVYFYKLLLNCHNNNIYNNNNNINKQPLGASK